MVHRTWAVTDEQRSSWQRGGHRVFLSEGAVCAMDQGLGTSVPFGEELSS